MNFIVREEGRAAGGFFEFSKWVYEERERVEVEG